MANNAVVNYMVKKGFPLNRENYLALAYFGEDPPEKLSDDDKDAIKEMLAIAKKQKTK